MDGSCSFSIETDSCKAKRGCADVGSKIIKYAKENIHWFELPVADCFEKVHEWILREQGQSELTVGDSAKCTNCENDNKFKQIQS